MRLLGRLRAASGVQSVRFSGYGIYTNRGSNTQVTTSAVAGLPAPQQSAFFDLIGPAYFQTLHTRLLAGREFNDRDSQGAPKVAVVSREFARHFFPDGNAVGRDVSYGKPPQQLRVVGVVDDIHTDIRRAPRRMMYLAQAQM